jgi:hypothetical protein
MDMDYGTEPRVPPPLEAKVLDIEVENLGYDSFSDVIRAFLRMQCAPLVQATAAVTGISNTYAPSIIVSGNSISGSFTSSIENPEDVQDPFHMKVIVNQDRPNISFFERLFLRGTEEMGEFHRLGYFYLANTGLPNRPELNGL